MTDFSGAFGQAQAEVGEPLGGGGLGWGDHAQAQSGRDLGAAHRHDHVHAFDPGHLVDQLPCADAEPFQLHPRCERAPQRQREEADRLEVVSPIKVGLFRPIRMPRTSADAVGASPAPELMRQPRSRI